MALDPPRSLSPSKVGTFKDCALAFKFSAIDRIPEQPSVATIKGTLVHSALERLFWNHPRGNRTREVAQGELHDAWIELQTDPEYLALGLPEKDHAAFVKACSALVDNEFEIEDPNTVEVVGVEMTLEAQLGDLRLRGIIDRLDLGEDGELTVVDYKTGRVPSENFEQSRMAGIFIYSLLCEQVLGRRPAKARLSYLKAPTAIDISPTEQALRGVRQRTGAVWQAIIRACEADDFRPRPSGLCKWCSFKDICPAFADTGD